MVEETVRGKEEELVFAMPCIFMPCHAVYLYVFAFLVDNNLKYVFAWLVKNKLKYVFACLVENLLKCICLLS